MQFRFTFWIISKRFFQNGVCGCANSRYLKTSCSVMKCGMSNTIVINTLYWETLKVAFPFPGNDIIAKNVCFYFTFRAYLRLLLRKFISSSVHLVSNEKLMFTHIFHKRINLLQLSFQRVLGVYFNLEC